MGFCLYSPRVYEKPLFFDNAFKARIVKFYMRSEYPNYKGQRVDDIRVKLKSKDKKSLNDFLDYCRITAGEKKVKNVERIMLQIYDVMEYSYLFDLQKLRKFLSLLNQSDKLTSTQNDIKKVLKRFLKWFYRDWNKRFDGFKDVRLKDSRNHDKINPSTLLKKDDIEKLIRKAENLRFKTLIVLMFESAGRPEEILKLKWHDVDLEKGSVKLHSGKTGRVRINPIKESIGHIRRYQQEYPYPSVHENDFIFPSSRDRNKPLSLQTVYDYLKKIGKKAISRPVFPYLFRHARLTLLHQKLSPKAYEKFADHSIETAIRHYSHLSNDDLREEMLEKIFHIDEIKNEDNQKIRELEINIEKFKETNKSQAESINSLKSENKKIWEWLDRLNNMNKTILSAVTRNKKLEDQLISQLKKITIQ
jgi:integrase/uncharacterized protein YdcH (DUF465 family)